MSDSAAQIFWIVNTAGARGDKPTILTMDGNQRYQLTMADGVDATFFHWAPPVPGLQFNYDPRYANDRVNMQALMDIRGINQYIDAAIAHDRYQHVERLFNVANALGFPLIYVEHQMPKPGYDLEGMRQYLDKYTNIIVFKTKEAQEAWGYTDEDSRVIYDWSAPVNKKYKPKSSKWLLWYNHIDLNPTKLWLDIRDRKDLPIEVRGWNGCMYYETAEEEESTLLARHAGFVNLHESDPLPLLVLQAAARGLPIISIRNATLAHFFSEDSIMFINSANELAARLKTSDDKCKKYGINARKVIEKHFNRKTFKNNWEALIKECSYE
jgi:glycosyltransferase involved in cell wall biosynthesis